MGAADEGAIVAVDWGTSSFRAAVLARSGRILAETAGAEGIMAVPDRDFAGALARRLDGPLAVGAGLPVYLSGMIGSRNGWVEVPYREVPAGLADLAAGVLVREEGGRRLRFVPGLLALEPDGVPDVMRGEEVQIFGTAATAGVADCEVVLPGTHSKWASLRGGRITGFRTFMTGEVFAALRRHTILGQLAEGDDHDAEGFASGVRRGASDPALTHALFGARTLPLTGRLAPGAVASYLSGLLIGAEFAGAAGTTERGLPHFVVGSGRLVELYRTAAALVGLDLAAGPADAAFRGLLAIAREIEP